jgi:NitT/TauT family transport system permease protein/taurine transport system permease protein
MPSISPPVGAAADPTGRPVRGPRALGRAAESVTFLVPLAVLVAVWAAVKPGLGLGDDVIASPPQVLRAAWELVGTGVLPSFVSVSMGRLTVGALLACAAGVPIGALLGLTRYGAVMFEPFLRFFQAVSGIAWLPLAIIWFGFTNQTIFVVIVYTAFIPVVFNTMTGIRTVPPIYAQAVETMGGGRLRAVWSVYLPGALPSIVVGLRLGIGYGWRALIAGEMLAGKSGLGFLIFDARRFHVIDTIMAGMIIIGLLYLVVDRMIFGALERLTVQRWGVVR